MSTFGTHLTIATQNVRGALVAKQTDIQNLLEIHNYDVLILTETCHSKKQATQLTNITLFPGYCAFPSQSLAQQESRPNSGKKCLRPKKAFTDSFKNNLQFH